MSENSNHPEPFLIRIRSALARWFKENRMTTVLFLALIGLLLYRQAAYHNAEGDLVGSPAPWQDVKTTTGQSITTADFRGRTVLLNFWATWCLPCKIEAPALAAIHAEHPDLLLVALTSENEDVVKRYLKENPPGYPVVIDAHGFLHDAYRVQVFPTLVFIKPDGTIDQFSHGLDFFLRWKIRRRLTGSFFAW